jgi:DNA-cytosine methyltransferase
MIEVGSDFSGVGAFNQALNRLEKDYKKIFACDIDKYARETYLHNYPAPKDFPEDVYERKIPKKPLDLYMTSPPCQSFSLAGHRKGEDDTRGVLFYNSHEFIQKNKPRYFIFENVKGLLSDDEGKTFQRWCDYLGGKSVNGNPVIFPLEQSVPYHIYYKVLNAKHYGVPQNRERIFIIGIRDDQDNDFTFPKPMHLTKRLKDVLEDSDNHKYLSDKKIDKIANSNFAQEKDMIQDANGVCGALLSRDYKDPKCVDEKYNLSEEAISRLTNESQGFHSDIKTPEDIASCHGARDYEKLARGMNVIKTVDEKYYLSDKMIEGFLSHKDRHEDKGTGFGWKPKTEDDIANTIRANASLCPTDNSIKQVGKINNSQSGKIYSSEGLGVTITGCGGGQGAKTGLYTVPSDQLKIVGMLPNETYNDFSRRVYDSEGLGRTLMGSGGNCNDKAGQYQVGTRIRRLTPRECFRLMDFPETFNWTVSDTQAYKQAGNSIVVSVLYEILKKLKL